jgi:CBS domain-containing protein
MPTLARDVMTRDVVTVTLSTPVADVAQMFSEDQISGAPVVDAQDRLVGIVSRTHVLTGLLEERGEGTQPALRTLLGLPETEEAEPEDGGDLPEPEGTAAVTVEDVMEGDPVTVAPDTALADVARRMAKDRLHRVVVVEGDRVVGILTSIDVLGRFSEAPAAPRGRASGAARKPKAPAAARGGRGRESTSAARASKPRSAKARGARGVRAKASAKRGR